jgi:hypothetical protein
VKRWIVDWAIAAIVAVGALAPAADARAVEYRYSGQLRESFGSYPAGTAFSGTFVYENEQADLSPGMDRGDFVAKHFTLDIGTDHLVYAQPGVINIYDASFYPTDMFHYYTPGIVGQIGGVPVYVASLVLQDLGGKALADANLPATPLKLGDFTQWNASFLELQGKPTPGAHGTAEIARGSFDMFEVAEEQHPPKDFAYRYSGQLREPFGAYPAGTPFSGTFLYDGNQSDLSPGLDRGDFVAKYFTLDIGTDHLTYAEPGVINIYDASFYPTDMFHYYTPGIVGQVGGVPVYVASLVLQDASGQALADASLPVVPLRLSAFTNWTASFLELQGESSPGMPASMQIARGSFDVFEPVCLPVEPVVDPDIVFSLGCFESETGGCKAAWKAKSAGLCPLPGE